jgi:hypothetical protein
MANRDAPLGFRVVGHLAGGLPNRFKAHHIASALASNIARGDAVIPVNTSKNIDFPGGDTVRVLGVFDGCFYQDVNFGPVWAPRWASGTTPVSGTVVDANVYDDPKLIFEVQYDGTFAAADIGALGDLVRTASDAATGQSRMEVDSAGSGTNTKILDLVNRPDNALGAAAKILVAFAVHYHGGALTAI